ncbi:hypothetical protein [Mucilaginibacter sp. HD30]
MAHYFNLIRDYLFHQADLHHLDPWIFLVLYLLSKLLFLIFVARAIKNLKDKQSFLLPLLFAALGYSLPYLYMVISGKDIPLWIFTVITVIYIFSGWSIYRKLRAARLETGVDTDINEQF